MNLLVLYLPKSEHATKVEEYINDFERQNPEAKVRLIDAESIEGIAKAKLYDILQFPALLAVAENDNLISEWVGDTLPLMQEVVAYLRS